ncbi:unnamed protein product [Penicillium salamii]|nr:unnamed protein product [Penicillium salamii]
MMASNSKTGKQAQPPKTGIVTKTLLNNVGRHSKTLLLLALTSLVHFRFPFSLLSTFSTSTLHFHFHFTLHKLPIYYNMDTNFEVTTSPIFTILVGPDKKKAYIHSAMLANTSDVLNALVHGGMKEAKEKKVEWPHVDEETFSRFFQFVYGRDYVVPSPIVLSIPEDADNSHPENDDTNPSPEESDWNRTFSLQENWPEFGPLYIQSYEDHHWVDDEFPHAQITWQPSPTYANQDWTPFFTKQAQLYVVADMYLVEPLIRLVLLRTYSFLRQFELLETNMDTVIDFIYLVYENTAPRYGDRVDRMRDLVARYVAVVARAFEKYEAFTQLLEDHGDFAADLWRVAWGH